MNKRVFIVLLAGASLAVAQSEPLGAGHWEGTIQLPKKNVRVNVDLARNEKQWAGSLTLPDLAFSPVVFAGVIVDGSHLTLSSRESMLQIEGTLSSDGRSFKGDFISGFMLAVPVPIELHSATEGRPAALPASGPLTSDLEGKWEGSLVLTSSWEENDQRVGVATPVRIVLRRGPDGSASGAFGEFPLSAIRQRGTRLQFEAKGAGAVFVGDLKGDELAGQWTQFDADPVSLTLRRAAN